MRIVSRKALRLFWNQYPDAEQPLKSWYRDARKADWKAPQEVKAQYGNASVLRGGRIVFNIGGNKYRLIAHINYIYHGVYIRFVGTHAQYDVIDAETI